jgi:hypothetical protein
MYIYNMEVLICKMMPCQYLQVIFSGLDTDGEFSDSDSTMTRRSKYSTSTGSGYDGYSDDSDSVSTITTIVTTVTGIYL